MASIRKLASGKYQVQIKRDKKRYSKSFQNKKHAEEWAYLEEGQYLEKKMQDKKEHQKYNTRFVLLAIVVLFILTHSFRLAFRIYEILLPRGNTADHFEQCYRLGR